MTNDLIRVVLADDHAIVRSGLKAVLGAARDIMVVGEASNGREAVALAERLQPDVIVMDLSMGEMDGVAATKEVAARGNGTRVLVLTRHAEEEYLVPLLEAGASGYLVKSAADRELARGLKKRDEHADERTRYERLTEREREVLRLVAEGYTAPEMGEKLFISPKTVDTYKQRVNEKLGLQHRTDYVKLALKLGLLQG